MSRLLKLDSVEEKVGFKRAKIYQLIKAGRFPRPIKIGVSSRWNDEDLNRWINEEGWKQAANA